MELPKTIAVIMYIVALIVFCAYVYQKWIRRKYLVSIFNIGIYIYAFALFVVPLFLGDDTNWAALGITADGMQKYLYESIALNSFGLIIMTTSMAYFEFGHTKTRWIKIADSCQTKINGTVINLLFIAACAGWYTIVFRYNHGMPLLNGGRTFYLNRWFSPIYLALNQIIICCALYYGIRVVYRRKDILLFAVSICTVAFQGNRGSLLTGLLMPIGVLMIYSHTGGKKRKSTVRLVQLAMVLLVAGLILTFVRSGSPVSFEGIKSELIAGNTFSDIRDGAYILKGFYENYDGHFLLGKTYAAGLISFIPSSLSPFRYKWSFGRFTTEGLFGMTNHFGLRGGSSMEAFLNFGVVGIIIFSALQGYLSGSLENVFNKYYFEQLENKMSGKEYFAWCLIGAIGSGLTCTSAFYNTYVVLLLFFALFLVSAPLRLNKALLDNLGTQV